MMSMVNDTHRFVFLHVAKTGGRSMNGLLIQQVGHEGTFNTKKLDPNVNRLGRMLGLEAKALAGDAKWQSYFTFAFVRNPWDRAVSIYENMRTDYAASRRFSARKKFWVRNESEKAKMLRVICARLNISPKNFSFDHFVYGVLRDRAFENYHWDKQSNALTDGNGTILFDFVGRFERLQLDFDHACGAIELPRTELPHRNKSNRSNWESYYTQDSMKTVAEIYGEDIDLFEYSCDLSAI